MERLLQPATPPLDLRRQDTRRGLCYGRNDGEIGGVKTNPIHLSQAAKLSHQAGPPQTCLIVSPPARFSFSQHILKSRPINAAQWWPMLCPAPDQVPGAIAFVRPWLLGAGPVPSPVLHILLRGIGPSVKLESQ